VLEALYSGGIEAVLFVTPPSGEMLRRYDHVRAFGIAGNSRTMSPEEMDTALPGVFQTLLTYNPRIVHYKVCSTFDSSPDVGSIGRAIDIGQSVFNNTVIPLVVASPLLGRYCVFGNLFARSGLGSEPFRLDRHPAMRNHQVTPMAEADLRAHLALQTSRSIELVDILALESGYDTARNKLFDMQMLGTVALFDSLTDEHLTMVGQLICDIHEREQKPLFVVGSSGANYALVNCWRRDANTTHSVLMGMRAPSTPISSVDRTIILSGSCSPVTNRQINWAIENDFADVAVDPLKVSNVGQHEPEINSIANRIITLLDRGQSVIVHTSRGPSDPRIAASRQVSESEGSGPELGDILGKILLNVLRDCQVSRVAIVGGDTAGQVARALGVEAVEMMGPLEPGAPLCVVRSRDDRVDGLEVTFKGGQVGYDDFFGTLLSGRRKEPLIGAIP
jgi:3-oxoisoapionate kinase